MNREYTAYSVFLLPKHKDVFILLPHQWRYFPKLKNSM